MIRSLQPDLSIVSKICSQNSRSANKIKPIWFLIAAFCLIGFLQSAAQISINSTNFEYVQNFDGLATINSPWSNNITLSSWYAAQQNELPALPASIVSYRAGIGSSATEGLYSFGSSGAADRALGAINKDATESILYGALFQNNTVDELHSVTLSFTVEQWRKVFTDDTDDKMYQRVKVSYANANVVSVAANDLFNDNFFVDIPEAFFTNIDTATNVATNLDGNTIKANITVTFPVVIPPNTQFFLRFLDENSQGVDIGLAVDDLHVTFSTTSVSIITALSDYTVSPYLDIGIVSSIPGINVPGIDYLTPSNAELTEWSIILQNFYSEQWASVDGSDYGYQLVQFTNQQSGRVYYVLRKQSTSAYYWGTYVKAINPGNSILSLQAPHPNNDEDTGFQAAAVFDLLHARAIMFAGISRCAGANSGCQGQTSACVASGQSPFKVSDVPHVASSVFHVATTVLADQHPELVFLQLHGFSQESGESDFYVSCGTLDAHQKSVPDYPVLIRENLLSIHPQWNVTITHVDNDEHLGGRNNVQGRYLNLYDGDYCFGVDDPVTVTNRFLHIEQYSAFRVARSNYDEMASIVGTVINGNPYIRHISIDNISDTYTQTFDNLFKVAGPYTWGNNVHLPGWYAVRGEVGLFSTYGLNDGATATGGLYAYGESGSSDRALGALNTNSETKAVAYGVLFKNETGLTISSIRLNYRGEQWRGVNSAAQQVQLSYSIGSSTDLRPVGILNNLLFTNVPAGNLVSPNITSNGPMDGNTNQVVISNLNIPVEIENDEEIFIRFLDNDDAGADKAMALDDFSISFSANALLIDWLYFNVIKSQGLPLLQWGSNGEDECNRYEILRSTNGVDFQSVGTMPCQQQALANHYEFIDRPSKWASIVYYRIAQYDTNGDVTYSEVKSFRQKPSVAPSIQYQNGSFVIQTTTDATLEAVIVLDAVGRVLCNANPIPGNSQEYTLPCPAAADQFVIVKLILNNGSYVGRLKTGQ
jgi:hypothetical protein